MNYIFYLDILCSDFEVLFLVTCCMIFCHNWLTFLLQHFRLMRFLSVATISSQEKMWLKNPLRMQGVKQRQTGKELNHQLRYSQELPAPTILTSWQCAAVLSGLPEVAVVSIYHSNENPTSMARPGGCGVLREFFIKLQHSGDKYQYEPAQGITCSTSIFRFNTEERTHLCSSLCSILFHLCNCKDIIICYKQTEQV